MFYREMKMINLNAARPLTINQADPNIEGRAAKEEKLIQELQRGRKDFSGLNLSGFRFTKLDLSGCNFSRANLQGLQVDYLTLDGADFSGANWSGARLKSVEATRATLNGVTFSDAHIRGQFYSCSFSKADLSRATIFNSQFRDCNFEKAELQGIEMEATDFERVNFNRIQARLRGNLQECKFRDVSWTSSAPKLTLWNTSFTDVDFSHTDFWDSQFMQCSFIGSIEFENCRGFRMGADCMFENVNLLPLRHTPESMWEEREFDQVRRDFFRSQSVWHDVIYWERVENSDPVLSLDLEIYKSAITAFDSVERKYLREKVTAVLAQRPDLATPEALELFEEIKKLDDELPAREPTVGKYAYTDSEIIYTSSRDRHKNAFLKQEKVMDLSVDSTSTSSGSRSRIGSDSSSGSDKEANSFQLFG